MKMNLIPLLGALAALVTTVATLPQAIRMYRTRQVRDVSLPTYSIMTIGLILWLGYGIGIGDLPLILANAVTLVIVSSIVFMKLWFGRSNISP